MIFIESKISITNTSFSNIAALDTGVIQVSENSMLNVQDSSFSSNAAIMNGVLKISGDSQFAISDSTFSNNMAQKNSIGQIIQVSKSGNFSRITVRNNRAWLSDIERADSEGICIEILSCQGKIAFAESNFKDNRATTNTPNVFISDVKSINISDSTFWNSQDNGDDNEQISGGFINIISSSKLFVTRSQFINGSALHGGAIFTWGGTTLSI